MQVLEEFVDQVVQAHRDGVSVIALQSLLIVNGVEMDPEEVSLLLEIVSLETTKQRSNINGPHG